MVSALSSLQQASRAIFGPSFLANPSLKLRFEYWTQALRHTEALADVIGKTGDAVQRAVERDPQSLGVLIWPLVDARWTASERLKAMAGHYREVEQLGPSLSLALNEVRPLIGFEGELSTLSVRLERQAFFRREGQLALSIFHAEDRIFSVAFLLGRRNGQRVAYVGAIQGVKQAQDSALYKVITKDAYGLRPRDLVIAMFLLFCEAIDVARVLAVQDEHRSHRHAYFGREGGSQVLANYDDIWSEHDGALNKDGLYEIAAGIRMKSMESIASKKRSMYRKRYQFLQNALTATRSAISSNQPVVVRPVEFGTEENP
jgi:uncharacterized protein VirK/YbjX